MFKNLFLSSRKLQLNWLQHCGVLVLVLAIALHQVQGIENLTEVSYKRAAGFNNLYAPVTQEGEIKSSFNTSADGGNQSHSPGSDEENAMLQTFKSFPNNQMWKPRKVSEQTPFLFMHQRKAGGTSLRCTLHSAANSSNMASFIPCYAELDCRIFNIPMSPPYAVYALHATWGDLVRLASLNTYRNFSDEVAGAGSVSRNPSKTSNDVKMYDHSTSSFSKQTTNSTPPALPNPLPETVPPKPIPILPVANLTFACLTNFREPVSRVVSCLHFRFSQYFLSRNWFCINDLSVARMTKLLVEKVDTYKNSCLNEPFRVLGPIEDEQIVTSLGYEYNNATYQVSARHGELERSVLNATLHNLQRCVPIVLELPHSRRLLSVAFPSLHALNAFDHAVKEQRGHNYSANCTAPTAAHLHVLRQLTSLERTLYRAVVNKVHSALKEFHMEGGEPTNRSGHNHLPHTKHHGNHSNPHAVKHHITNEANSSLIHSTGGTHLRKLTTV